MASTTHGTGRGRGFNKLGVRENLTWADWHAENPVLFPLIEELSLDESGIGVALRSFPGWLIKEADRWPDPWKFLREIPSASDRQREVFLAAPSVIAAIRRLARMSLGIASLNTDWEDQIHSVKDGDDKRAVKHATRMVFAGLWQLKHFRENAVDSSVSPAVRAELTRRGELLRSDMVRHGKRGDADEPKDIPGNKEVLAIADVGAFLATHWLRCYGSEGKVPGLMFFSNDALTKLVLWKFKRKKAWFANLGRDFVKKTRQQLKLLPASRYNPAVWSLRADRSGEGGSVVTGCKRDGTMLFRFLGR